MALGAYTIINVNEAIQMLSRTRSRRSASLIRLPTPVNGEAGGGDSCRPVRGATAVAVIGPLLGTRAGTCPRATLA